MKSPMQAKLSALAVAISCMSGMAQAESAASLEQAITEGDASLNFRYRFEFVDQVNTYEAKASTLKTRLTYKTKEYQNASAVLEFDNNSEVFSDNYNSKTNGQTQHAVVADPTYTEINQAYIDYKAPADTLVRFGRQRILLDNQRFVGGVGWRQNEQTYDALAIVNTSLPDTTITLANISNINNILGANTNGKDHQVLHVKNTSLPVGTVSAYAYLLDKISDTYGVRLAGSQDMNDVKVLYEAELATQDSDTSNNDAEYLHLMGGATMAGVTAKLGYEVQTSDGGNYAFSTPLGTNHKFGGWADKFLGTPANGLEDLYLSVSTKLAGPNIAVTYHQFDAENGGQDYGSELDLAVSQKFAKRYGVLLKYASYNAEDFSVDTDKLWLQLTAAF